MTMRGDRKSAHESLALPFDAAMRHELTLGVASLASGEAVEGATRFAGGKGRHGSFE
jgi:enoyl-CoA hydratase